MCFWTKLKNWPQLPIAQLYHETQILREKVLWKKFFLKEKLPCYHKLEQWV